MKRFAPQLAAAMVLMLLFASLFLVASCGPVDSGPSTSVEIDIDHHKRPKTKAPAYRKPATPPRMTKRR
ncbi:MULTISPECIES: hypothetical protein [unclassified Streptomyces]|uniref:hypothetical protein n=1 Tax=unclassified Streptomyces TaxID=2593676 RepID=UPI0036EDCBE8